MFFILTIIINWSQASLTFVLCLDLGSYKFYYLKSLKFVAIFYMVISGSYYSKLSIFKKWSKVVKFFFRPLFIGDFGIVPFKKYI